MVLSKTLIPNFASTLFPIFGRQNCSGPMFGVLCLRDSILSQTNPKNAFSLEKIGVRIKFSEKALMIEVAKSRLQDRKERPYQSKSNGGIA